MQIFESFIAVTARAALAHRAFNGSGSVAAFKNETQANLEKYQLKTEDPAERQKIADFGNRAIETAERDKAVTMTCIVGA